MKGFRKKILFAIVAMFPSWALCDLSGVRADPSAYPQYALQEPPATEFIKMEELVELVVQRKRPLIIDVRTREEYEDLHILGSISIPLSEFPHSLQKIPKDKIAVLY